MKRPNNPFQIPIFEPELPPRKKKSTSKKPESVKNMEIGLKIEDDAAKKFNKSKKKV